MTNGTCLHFFKKKNEKSAKLSAMVKRCDFFLVVPNWDVNYKYFTNSDILLYPYNAISKYFNTSKILSVFLYQKLTENVLFGVQCDNTVLLNYKKFDVYRSSLL